MLFSLIGYDGGLEPQAPSAGSTHPTGIIRPATATESAFLVKVRGPGLCSGAPIEGTKLVVTAAHCVVEQYTNKIGALYDLRVERDGIRYDISEVLVDTVQTGRFNPAVDVAILVLHEPVEGPKLLLADSFTPEETATLIGYQPSSSNGSWLRGSTYSSHQDRMSSDLKNHVPMPAACSLSDTDFKWSKNHHWWISCGMVPGASGGPLVKPTPSGPALVGVTSSVDFELKFNGVAPVSKIHSLLANRDAYRKVLDGPSAPCCNAGDKR